MYKKVLCGTVRYGNRCSVKAKRNVRQITVYVTPEAAERIKRRAAKNHRSISAQCAVELSMVS